MPLEGTDLFVIQRQTGGSPLLKATATQLNSYVSKTLNEVTLKGNNSNQDITLGTDKITLDAGAGSITAAGNILANGGVVVDGGSSLSTGLYYRDDSTSYGLALYSGGSAQKNRKVFIKTDGSALFAGALEAESIDGGTY